MILLREPYCYICSQPRSKCLERWHWEVEHDVPDPHDFQTREDADAARRKKRAEP